MSKLLLSLLFCLLTSISLCADPIVITGGSATLTGDNTGSPIGGSMSITGANFTAGAGFLNGSFGIAQCTVNINPNGCTSANLGFLSVGLDAPGGFVLNGVPGTYGDPFRSLAVFFTAPTFVIPAELVATANAVRITAPFSFSGTITTPETGLFSLTGQGTVVLLLERRTFGQFGQFNGLYIGPGFGQATYTFGDVAPGVTVENVPEPATLLLFGSGLAFSLLRKKSKS